MKKYSFVLIAFLSFAAHAGEYVHPSADEISKNQACFQDVEVLGCRTQEEDPAHFQSCLSDVQDSLSESCRKMMTKLYGE